MKKAYLITVLVLMLISLFSSAQQVNLSLNNAQSRTISDFYGLNGQNTLDANSDYANPQVRIGLISSKAKYLRYPGGTTANYWDWQEGWFFRGKEDKGALSMDLDFQKLDRLAPVFAGAGSNLNTQGSNYIQDFAVTLANTGTKPLFVLNPLTSDLNYQIAMLLEAKLQNLNVNRVEIGNEFYLSSMAYQEKFGTATEYADLVKVWKVELKKYLGSNLKISAVAANTDYLNAGNDRRLGWNNELVNAFGNDMPDVFSLHQYKASGLQSYQGFSSDYKVLFGKVLTDITEVNTYINQVSPSTSNIPVWITEYNLFDKSNLKIHGTWYHGLIAGFETLKLLENKKIEGCNLHAQSGNFVFANFFNSSTGLESGGDFSSPACSSSAPASVAYSKTSEGIVMEQIALALNRAISGAPINFSSAGNPVLPEINTGNLAIYGWQFNNSNNNNTSIILNLSDTEVPDVNVNNLGYSSPNSRIVQISVDNPQYYANGAVSTGPVYSFVDCGVTTQVGAISSIVPSNGKIKLPKFSVTRIFQSSIWAPVIEAQSDNIVAGSKLAISITNMDTIPVLWSTGDTTQTIFVYPTADTSFTVFYTTPGISLLSSKTIAVHVVSSPVTVSISAPNVSYCPGSSPIKLTANATGGDPAKYKYIWITSPTNDEFPDENRGVGNTQDIYVNPDFPTIYTVYVTDETTVAKSSISIDVPTAFNLMPEYTSCKSNALSIELSHSATTATSYSYDWQGINHVVSSTPPNIVISSSTVSISDILTVYAINGTCTTSKNAKVNFFNCCNNTSYQLQPGSDLGDLLDLLDHNGTVFTYSMIKDNVLQIKNSTGINTPLIFNGDFHIKNGSNNAFYKGIQFNSMAVRFTEGASMVIEPGYSLELIDADFDNECNGMWKGVVNNSGEFSSDGLSGNSSIKHAEVALNSLPGSKLIINNTNFYDNILGIEADHLSLDGDNIQSWKIGGSTFSHTNMLSNKYAGQFWDIGSRPMAGISLNNTNVLIGVSASQGGLNTFSDMHSGIISSQAQVEIKNAIFSNIESDPVYPYKPGSSCIYGNNQSKINVIRTTFNAINTNNALATKGILLNNAGELIVNHSDFNGLQKGIETDWSHFNSYSVTENTFTDCLVGLEWWNSRSNTQANISKNHFLLSASTSHAQDNNYEAIHVFGTYNDFPLLIEGNDIHNHLAGIFAINLYGKQYEQKIINNLIDLDFTEDEVNANNFEFRGISLQNCEFTNVIDNNISWNTTNNTFLSNVQGIRFESCRGSLFSLNEITNMRKGFYGAGTCEETRLLCNTINESYPSGMFFDAIDLTEQGYNCGGSGNVWNGNDYNASLNNFKIDEGLPGVPIEWYYIGSSSTNNNLSPFPYKGFVILPQIASTSCQQVEPCGVSSISGKYYNGDSDIRSDYLNKIIIDTLNYPNNIVENQYYDKIYALSSLIEDSTKIINDFYKEYFDALKGSNIDNLLEVIKLMENNEFSLALIKNNSILYQNILEENLKNVNSIYLSRNLTNSFEDWAPVENIILRNVAYQPAMLGGRGVYLARSLKKLRLEDGASSLRLKNYSNESEVKSEIINLFPNPVCDLLTIEFSNTVDGYLKIMDASGKEIFHYYISNINFNLNLEKMSSGIYFLEFISNTGSIDKRKLIIQH